MYSASELIEALQRRLRKGRSIRPPRPAGEYPPGWVEWFASTDEAHARTARAETAAMVGVLLAREPVYRKGYKRLNTLQSFIRLWRYDWREAPAPDRRSRVFAMSLSLLLHVLWLQLMILLIVARTPSDAEEAARLGEDVVQVEFIGEGTPEEEGGGAQQEPAPVPEVASAAPAAAAEPAQAPVATAPPPEPSVAEVETPPEPEVPPPPAEQPLQVTETPEPDTSFVLEPPRIAEVPMPALQAPEIQVPTREIPTVEVPMPAAPPEIRPLPEREIAVPDLQQPELEVAEREVPTLAPAPRISSRVPTNPVPAAPELDRDGPEVAERDIPLRSTGSAQAGESPRPADGTAQETPTAGTASSPSTTAGGNRDAGEGTAATATGTGAGEAPSAPPGALPSPRRSDDWGDSTRNVPGGRAGSASGLFNADGSPRLAGDGGKVGGGLPPGTITEDYEKIDRMGTWLKRPPAGYDPTAFDRFWVPHETLLEEWVRRSIKEVLIPIPGTGKRIRCTVAMLMLGGACGISDPNMLDNEAEARKPPDVPFKAELQEDQESLRQPATP